MAARSAPPYRADHVGSLLRRRMLGGSRTPRSRLIVETAEEILG
jgi:hypothetical protein